MFPGFSFEQVAIPKGWMVWMQDFWKLAYKKARIYDIKRRSLNLRKRGFLGFGLNIFSGNIMSTAILLRFTNKKPTFFKIT